MLLIEKEDCDAGTVGKIREGLAQGGAQFKVLRDIQDTLTKKLENAPPSLVKKLHLKLGVARYFLGFMDMAIEHLKQVEVALGYFYLGRAYLNREKYSEALGAFDKAEAAGYSHIYVQLQRAGVYRQSGEIVQARKLLSKLQEQSSHSADYHYQLGCCLMLEGNRYSSIKSLERAVELDPSHTGALFQLGYFNDLSGNDEEAIHYYERCLKYPPVHKGVLNNLGVLYEDVEKYDKAVDCYQRLAKIDPQDERAKLFLKDAAASQTMTYNPNDESDSVSNRQVLEIQLTDFELSVRSRNCLKKMGLRTLGDLTRVTEQSLLASKNFGETSLEEVKKIMVTKGLRVGQSLDQGAQYDFRNKPQQTLTPEEQAMLARPVSDLNLSVRSRKCMNRLQIATIGELVSRSGDELMEAKNFGITSLNEVREKLKEMNIKLRGD